MTTSDDLPRQFLGEARVVSRSEQVDQWVGLMRVLTRHLLLVQPDLPSPARESVTAAAAVWITGTSGVDDLIVSKRACWTYLGAQEGLGPQPWNVASTRAVLAVLEPSGDEEKMDLTAEWFCIFLGLWDDS